MKNGPNINMQPGCLDQLKVVRQALDKKKVTTLVGVVFTIGVLVVAGVRKGVP